MTEALLIIAMAIVTFIPRYLPFALAERLRFPKWLEEALQFVPVAVLTVIIVQTAAFRDGSLHIAVDNAYLWALATAFAVALLQKNMLLTILAGMSVFSAVKWFLLQ